LSRDPTRTAAAHHPPCGGIRCGRARDRTETCAA
jgi:hypothetical protein